MVKLQTCTSAWTCTMCTLCIIVAEVADSGSVISFLYNPLQKRDSLSLSLLLFFSAPLSLSSWVWVSETDGKTEATQSSIFSSLYNCRLIKENILLFLSTFFSKVTQFYHKVCHSETFFFHSNDSWFWLSFVLKLKVQTWTQLDKPVLFMCFYQYITIKFSTLHALGC